MRLRHAICTLNNPSITLQELSDSCKAMGAITFSGQLEKAPNTGTPHFQFYLQFANQRTTASIAKKLKCSVLKCISPLDSYNYCAKEETRSGDEGPLQWGPLPKPEKNKAGSTKEFNDQVLNEGPEAMVADGRLSIKDYLKIK